MALLTDRMLEKMSEEIVGRFLHEKIALNDGVVDAAQREQLSPEQIKRLVESVNTQTFLRKFNDKDSSKDDRYVEFDTANPHSVMNKMLDTAGESMGACCEHDDEDATDMMSELPSSLCPKEDDAEDPLDTDS